MPDTIRLLLKQGLPMSGKSSTGVRSLWHELRVLSRRARQVWSMVPRRFKWALGGAALLMALASACATAVPLVIGYLIDGIKDRTAPPHATGESVFHFATYCLVGIAGLVLLREGLHVFRRYLVESTCTRIDKPISVRVVSHL